MQETRKEPFGWSIEEFDSRGNLIWSIMSKFRPTELSWLRDLPTKKHHIVITELHKKEETAEKITGVKSYRESTQRLIDANIGL
jgi:hypothetical protein